MDDSEVAAADLSGEISGMQETAPEAADLSSDISGMDKSELESSDSPIAASGASDSDGCDWMLSAKSDADCARAAPSGNGASAAGFSSACAFDSALSAVFCAISVKDPLSSNEMAASDISDSVRSANDGRFVLDESQSLMLPSVSALMPSRFASGSRPAFRISPKSSLKSAYCSLSPSAPPSAPTAVKAWTDFEAAASAACLSPENRGESETSPAIAPGSEESPGLRRPSCEESLSSHCESFERFGALPKLPKIEAMPGAGFSLAPNAAPVFGDDAPALNAAPRLELDFDAENSGTGDADFAAPKILGSDLCAFWPVSASVFARVRDAAARVSLSRMSKMSSSPAACAPAPSDGDSSALRNAKNGETAPTFVVSPSGSSDAISLSALTSDSSAGMA